MSITSQKLQRQEEIELKRNFLKKPSNSQISNIVQDQDQTPQKLPSQPSQNPILNLQTQPFQNSQFGQPQQDQRANIQSQQDQHEKTKQLIKSLLKPVYKQIQALNKKAPSNQEIQQTQQQIMGLSQYESLIPKNSLENYQALVSKMQDQIQKLEQKSSEIQKKEDVIEIEKNNLEQLKNKQIQEKYENDKEQLKKGLQSQIETLDFVASRKKFIKRLGGEFDYQGITEEVEDSMNELPKIKENLSKKLRETDITISTRNYAEEINELITSKQKDILNEFKKKYKIDFKNYKPELAIGNYSQENQKLKKNNIVSQIQTIPQQPIPGMKLQFHNYQPLLKQEPVQSKKENIVQKSINNIHSEQFVQEIQKQNEKIDNHQETLKQLIEDQIKVSAKQQVQIQLLNQKLSDNQKVNEDQIQEILDKQRQKYVEITKETQINQTQNNMPLPILPKNIIQQVKQEDDQFVLDSSNPETKTQEPLIKEFGLQYAKQKFGEMLFEIEKENNQNNLFQQQQEQQNQITKNMKVNKESVVYEKIESPKKSSQQPQQTLGIQQAQVDNFMNLANKLIQNISDKIGQSIQDNLRIPNQIQQSQNQNQDFTQFDLQLKNLPPLAEPQYGHKQLMQDLLNQTEDFTSKDGSISDSIFMINQNSSKSEGEISEPQYKILNQKLGQDDEFKSWLMESDQSQINY